MKRGFIHGSYHLTDKRNVGTSRVQPGLAWAHGRGGGFSVKVVLALGLGQPLAHTLGKKVAPERQHHVLKYIIYKIKTGYHVPDANEGGASSIARALGYLGLV